MLPRRLLLNAAIILFLFTFVVLKLQDRYTRSIQNYLNQQNATLSDAPQTPLQLLAQQSIGINGGRQAQSKSEDEGVDTKIDWSKFAYVLYATDPEYLCNSVMLIEQLHRLGAKPDLVLLYPNTMDLATNTANSVLIAKARDEYRAVVKPIEVLQKEGAQSETWAAAHTKFLAFNQTEYDRVLHLDSDAVVHETMDELFLLPNATMAMPRAYWISQEPKVTLCSSLMLMVPSSHEFERVLAEAENATKNEYDMDMVNDLYRNEAMVLPHHTYLLLTGEYRGADHRNYLGQDETAVWDPDHAFEKAKYVHFSDWPIPKPWLQANTHMWNHEMPKCYDAEGSMINGTETDACRDRQIWVGIYEDFKKRRMDVCGVNFVQRTGLKGKIDIVEEDSRDDFNEKEAAIELRSAEVAAQLDGHEMLELRSDESVHSDV